MPGERRADRDLSGLVVPDLPDHDDIRILSQDGAERAREVERDLALHLDLLDPGLPVLDRVFHRHDVLPWRLDRLEGGVQGRRLAAPGRPGHEDHPPRPPDRVAEQRELIGIEAEALERVVPDDGLLQEEAEDDLLTVNRGQGRDAEVDLGVVHAGREAAVLGQPPLRDVEPRDDLEPGDDGEVQLARHLEELVEQPVDSAADGRAILERLDVDVGGAVGGGPRQHVIDELDDGGVVRLGP